MSKWPRHLFKGMFDEETRCSWNLHLLPLLSKTIEEQRDPKATSIFELPPHCHEA